MPRLWTGAGAAMAASTYDAIPTVQDQAILPCLFHKLGDDATARSELDKVKQPCPEWFELGH